MPAAKTPATDPAAAQTGVTTPADPVVTPPAADPLPAVAAAMDAAGPVDDQVSGSGDGFAHAVTAEPEWVPQTVRYVVSDREQYPYASMITRPQAPNGAADISFTNPQGSAGLASAVPHISEVELGQPHWQGYDE